MQDNMRWCCAWGTGKQQGQEGAVSSQRPPYSPEQGDFRGLPPCSSGSKVATAIISPKQCILGGGGHVAENSLGALGRAGPGTQCHLLTTLHSTGEAALTASPAPQPRSIHRCLP